MKYGWNPDRPDQDDHLFAASPLILQTLPPLIDLRHACPPVYDQGQLGSCTANAIAGAIEFDQIRQNIHEATPSRLFIYYNERSMEHTTAVDAGAAIRDGVKSVSKLGVCSETEWPYDIQQFAVKPPSACYQDALFHKTIAYMRVARNLSQMKACLADGYTFIFGFTVYDSFESENVAKTGIVPMPRRGENVLGGHAVLCVGYDDSKESFICRNSWSANWGVEGYFYMPYIYLLNSGLSSDFWTIRSTH